MAKTTEITLPDEFASTMQQLVAEAEKTIAPRASADRDDVSADSEQLREELAAMSERMAALERTAAAGFEKIAATSANTDSHGQLQRLEEHLAAIRQTETVNQRLFNSLHQELKNYRDNFLRESLQKPFIRDLVMLFDDLSSLASQLGSSQSGAGGSSHWAANLDNAIAALLEILHRMEVTEVEPKERVDRALHRVVSYEPADFEQDDGLIVMRVKRGFVWRDQILRPEEVVAKRFA
jgi:molecular chaperone GrpE (heat shock protein)